MADRYRVGMTGDLPVRIDRHRRGNGSDFCRRYGLHRLVWADHTSSITDAITHEKRLKRWRREWKFALIERGKPEWQDLFDTMAWPRSGTPGQARGDGVRGSATPANGR